MTVWQRCWFRLSVLMLCLFSLAVVPAEAAVPAEFADQLFVNVNAPTAFAVLPDQRMLVTQQSGQLRLVSIRKKPYHIKCGNRRTEARQANWQLSYTNGCASFGV
jgi:hypothetical protein